MSESILHAYEVTYVGRPEETNVEIGGFLVDSGHVRKHHEPERVWQYFDMKSGTGWAITARHIGEYEKVRYLLRQNQGSRVL